MKRGRRGICPDGTVPVMVRVPKSAFDEACRRTTNLSQYGREAFLERLSRDLKRNQISTSLGTPSE